MEESIERGIPKMRIGWLMVMAINMSEEVKETNEGSGKVPHMW